MKTYALFQQYIWLINTLKNFGRLTLDEINELWLRTDMSEGISIARSTFNRHRDAILDMFGIIIDCNKKDGYRYFIYNNEVLDEDSIQNWMLSTLSVNIVLSESKVVSDRIILESIPSCGEKLIKVIEAMKQGIRLKVTYKRYSSEDITIMLIEPYFVKLFNKRWYTLVKYPEPDSPLFILSFDRILSIEITDEKYQYNDCFDPVNWFRDSYGIVRDDMVPIETIIIRAFGKEANYIRDLPFHHSQKEIVSDKNFSDFEMRLRPTADFWTPLLSRGSAIKILQPKWLADRIKTLHQDAASLYD